jgi:hypothetical protein
MDDPGSNEKQLELLATRLLDLATQQRDALRKGDFNMLGEVTGQRREAFEQLTTTLAAAQVEARTSVERKATSNADGGSAQRQRLGSIAAQVLEMDSSIKTLVANAMKQGAIDMEKVRRGRLALNYKKDSSLKNSSDVDMVR